MKRGESAGLGSGDWRAMLAAYPVRNVAVEVREKSENTVTVVVKTQKPNYMMPPISWFVPYNPEREIDLDAMGTRLWRWCDGQRTVEEVIDLFKDTYDLSFHEARAAVVDYLRKLIQRGILAVMMAPERPENQAETNAK